jgi:hypothetical protein
VVVRAVRARRAALLPVLAAGSAVACGPRAPRPELNVMRAPAVCDTVPASLESEDRGGPVPTAAAPADSGRVVGVVTDARTGRGARFVEVRLRRAAVAPADSGRAADVVRGWADTGGGFALGPVPPGAYTLDVRQVGYTPYVRPYVVPPGRSTPCASRWAPCDAMPRI